MNNLWFAVINSILYVGNIITAVFASTGVMGKYRLTYWSDRFSDYLTPPHWMFAAAWSIIYILIAFFIVSFYLSSHTTELSIPVVSILLAVSIVLNACWMIAWTYGQLILALVIIILLTPVVVQIDMSIKKCYESYFFPIFYTWRVTFGIYAAWLVFATILNLTVVMQFYGHSFAADTTWAIVWLAFVGVYSLILFAFLYCNGGEVILVAVVFSADAYKYRSTISIMITCIIFAALVPIVWIIVVYFLQMKKKYEAEIEYGKIYDRWEHHNGHGHHHGHGTNVDDEQPHDSGQT